MSSPIDQIKDRLDIVEVINGYVRLKKSGARHTGLCPFHTERTPSFTVTQEKQMWYCFGCGQGGDLFTFIEKIENIEFADALRLLAEKAGIKLEREDPKIRSERKGLYEAAEEAAKFFSRQLESKTGKAVAAYLYERGLTNESIKDWRLGYAPDNWRALRDYLKDRGYADATMDSAGLIVKSHDRFRHRIMFPIFNIQGQVIGFSGRVFDEVRGVTIDNDAGKYINTPNTLIYDKSRVLYGLDRAKENIRKLDGVIIIEGNIDLILAHQAGTKNAAAVFGTALTENQLSLVRRQTANLVLCFDSDEAGERAASRAAELATQKGFDVSVIQLPPGKDGADIIRENEENWQTLVEKPVPFVGFVLNRALQKFPAKTLAGKKAVVADVLQAVARLGSPVEREHWVRELATEVGSSEEAVHGELRRVLNRSSTAKTSNPEKLPETTPANTSEEYLLALAAAYPETKELLGEIAELVQSDEVRNIIGQLLAGADVEAVLGGNKKFMPLLARAAFLKEIVGDGRAEVELLIIELKRKGLKEKLRMLTAQLYQAERARDEQETRNLARQFTSLSRELSNYEKQRVKKI